MGYERPSARLSQRGFDGVRPRWPGEAPLRCAVPRVQDGLYRLGRLRWEQWQWRPWRRGFWGEASTGRAGWRQDVVGPTPPAQYTAAAAALFAV